MENNKKRKVKKKKNRQNQEKESPNGEGSQSVGSSALCSVPDASLAAANVLAAALLRDEKSQEAVIGVGGGAAFAWREEQEKDRILASLQPDVAVSTIAGRGNNSAKVKTKAKANNREPNEYRHENDADLGRRGGLARDDTWLRGDMDDAADGLSNAGQMNRDNGGGRGGRGLGDVVCAAVQMEGGDGDDTSDATSPIRTKSGSGGEDGTGANATDPPRGMRRTRGDPQHVALPDDVVGRLPGYIPSVEMDSLQGAALIRYLISRVEDLSTELAQVKGFDGEGSPRGDSSTCGNGVEDSSLPIHLAGNRENWTDKRGIGNGGRGGGGGEGGGMREVVMRETRRPRKGEGMTGGGDEVAIVEELDDGMILRGGEREKWRGSTKEELLEAVVENLKRQLQLQRESTLSLRRELEQEQKERRNANGEGDAVDHSSSQEAELGREMMKKKKKEMVDMVVEKVEHELEEMKRETSEMVSQHQLEWNGAKSEIEDMVERLREKLEMERECTQDLRRQLVQLEREKDRRKAEAESTIDDLRQQLHKERECKQALRQKIVRLENDTENLMSRLSEMETSISAIETDAKTMEEELRHQLQNEKDKKTMEEELLRHQLQNEKETAHALREQLSRLEDDVSMRKITEEGTRSEISRLRAENGRLEAQIAERQTEVEQLGIDRNHLAKKLSVVQEGMQQLERELAVRSRVMHEMENGNPREDSKWFGLGRRARDPIAEAAALAEESRIQKAAAVATIEKLLVENESLMSKVNEQSVLLSRTTQEKEELAAALDKAVDDRPLPAGPERILGGNGYESQELATAISEAEPATSSHRQEEPSYPPLPPASVVPSPVVSLSDSDGGLIDLAGRQKGGNNLEANNQSVPGNDFNSGYDQFSGKQRELHADIGPGAVDLGLGGKVSSWSSESLGSRHFYMSSAARSYSDGDELEERAVRESQFANGWSWRADDQGAKLRNDVEGEIVPVMKAEFESSRDQGPQQTKDKSDGRREAKRDIVPISASPLTGAPFRFAAFLARYLSGADLVK